MNILFIQGVSRYGGALKSLFRTLQILKKAGHKPVVVTSRENQLTRDCAQEGITFYTFPIGMWRKAKTWPFLPVTFYRLLKVIKEEEIELIHCNTLWDTPYGLVLSAITGLPVVTHLRNVHSKKLLAKYHVNLAKAIIGVSHACLKFLGPEERRKAKVIYNPLEPLKSAETPKTSYHPTLAIIGRVDTTKGQIEFIEKVFKRLIQQLNVTLYIVGEASQKEKFLENRVKEYEEQLNGKVIYTGYTPDVHKYYATSDVIVIPSKMNALEGVPRVAIEAASAKRPVAATRSGGTEEIVNHKKGVLVNNIEDLQKPLPTLLLHPSLQRKIAVNANAYISSLCSHEAHLKHLINIYEG